MHAFLVSYCVMILATAAITAWRDDNDYLSLATEGGAHAILGICWPVFWALYAGSQIRRRRTVRQFLQSGGSEQQSADVFELTVYVSLAIACGGLVAAVTWFTIFN